MILVMIFTFDTLYADAHPCSAPLKQLPCTLPRNLRPSRHRNPPRGWRREEGEGLEKEKGLEKERLLILAPVQI